MSAFAAAASDRQPAMSAPAAVVDRAISDLGNVQSAPARYRRNEEIFGEGDAAEFVYRIKSGTVRLYRILADGRRQIGAFHFAGDLFGFEAGSDHTMSAEAVTECELVAIPRERMMRSAEGDAVLSRLLWQSAIAELSMARDHMLLLGRQSAAERVAAFLLDMAAREGGDGVVTLPMSRQDIADYLGLTIETVSRTITHLTEQGTIQVPSSRRIVLSDRATLRRLDS